MSIAQRRREVPASPEVDPWRYGWRFVKVPGKRDPMQVPLTEEDILHPLEGDFIVNNAPHHDDCEYLWAVLKNRVSDDPTAVVLSDHRVDFNVPGVRPLGPDVVVFRGVNDRKHPATLHVGQSDAQTVLVVEVVSPESDKNDHIIKKRYYRRARVPMYVIVDPDDSRETRTLTITALRRGPRGWVKVAADAQGRVPLDGLDLLLGQRDGKLRCWDARNGEEIGDYGEVAQAADAHRRRASTLQRRAAVQRRRAETEQARAEAERQRAEAERQRAEAAEAKLRELEAEVAKLRAAPKAGSGKNGSHGNGNGSNPKV